MKIKFTNNAASNITTAIDTSSTSLEVTSGTGALFPALSSDEYFYATLVGQDAMEIVKVTARDGDTFTITRGQDGTTAQSFSAGDVIELRITAAAFNGIAEELTDVADTCVRLTGDQSISGEKTFTSVMRLKKEQPNFYIQDMNKDRIDGISANSFSRIYFVDKNGENVGEFQNIQRANGRFEMRFVVYQQGGSSNTTFGVCMDADGSSFAYAPTPEAVVNSTQIVTAAWVRARNTISTAAPSGGTAGDTWLQYIA